MFAFNDRRFSDRIIIVSTEPAPEDQKVCLVDLQKQAEAEEQAKAEEKKCNKRKRPDGQEDEQKPAKRVFTKKHIKAMKKPLQDFIKTFSDDFLNAHANVHDKAEEVEGVDEQHGNSKTIYVSAAIVASESMFFRTLWTSSMKDSVQETVYIKVDSATEIGLFVLMLQYIYSKKLPNPLTVRGLLHLFILANRYEVKSLMVVCIKRLKEAISTAEDADATLSFLSNFTLIDDCKILHMAAQNVLKNRFAGRQLYDPKVLDLSIAGLRGLLSSPHEGWHENDIYRIVQLWADRHDNYSVIELVQGEFLSRSFFVDVVWRDSILQQAPIWERWLAHYTEFFISGRVRQEQYFPMYLPAVLGDDREVTVTLQSDIKETVYLFGYKFAIRHDNDTCTLSLDIKGSGLSSDRFLVVLGVGHPETTIVLSPSSLEFSVSPGTAVSLVA